MLFFCVCKIVDLMLSTEPAIIRNFSLNALLALFLFARYFLINALSLSCFDCSVSFRVSLD